MIQNSTGKVLTSQCVKVGSNITLCCPIMEELDNAVVWFPNQIFEPDYDEFSETLCITFSSSKLSQNVVWCDYEGNDYYGIILKSGMFNL